MEGLLGSVHMLAIFFALFKSFPFIHPQLSDGNTRLQAKAASVLNILNKQSLRDKRG
jgi:hypothetical protein